MNNITLVNGPVNAIRLEGEVNNIKKIIYVFCDFHANVTVQKQCPSFESIDISKYMYYQFKDHIKSGKNHAIDIFFETYKSMTYRPNFQYEEYLINHRDRYIDEVNKILKMSVTFENNKIKYINKDIDDRKIRLHYMDFRDILLSPVFTIADNIREIANNLINNSFNISSDMVDVLVSTVNDGLKYLDYIGSLLNNKTPTDLPFEIDKEDINGLKQIMSKLTTKYSNKKVQKNVVEEIRNIYNTIVDRTKTQVGQLLELLPKYKELVSDYTLTLVEHKIQKFYTWGNYVEIENYGIKIYKILSFITDIFLEPFVSLQDLLLLRRFLDKDYITHAVSYTGYAHSMNYIDILIKQFDFKITNVVYSKYNNVDTLTKKIKEIDNSEKNRVDKLEIQSFLLPNKLTQCINLTDFPKMFN